MSKRKFIVLIFFMIIALIGIISVQVYWIKSSIDIREKQFSNHIRFALANVSENIQDRELNDFYNRYSPEIDSARQTGSLRKKDFYFQQIDTNRNEIFSLRQSILETNYKSAIPLFGNDSIILQSFLGEKEKEVKKISGFSGDFAEITPEQRVYQIGRMSRLESLQFENVFKGIAESLPIYDRVTAREIRMNIINQLEERGIDTEFEFAVYGDGLPTKVKSRKFKGINHKSYKVPIFTDQDGASVYQLYVNFPEKDNYLLGAVSNVLILSGVFILTIIIAFSSALYQLIMQKKISEIKTDFINNMTHEFKTPIATINLALDAIKNPKIITDKEKVLRYTEMIRMENKRMHGQVENVLRISRLEKNQLDLTKGVEDIHDIITDAVSHIQLIIDDKGGYVKTHFEAKQSEVMINNFHFTNVIVNVLDNAVKYTKDLPKIDVYTENAGNNIVIHIKDQGIGMSKAVQKHVFDKFYREQRSNIHDVKGHGLGLAYVKKIVEHHHGNIYVESEKGKGSTFTIKLPLI